ncbi:RNA-directed DNA polymerase from mobile element jockey [Stylophora pistillata]|uniref:RNA-directed DNA polymerase from mobile element jockey n=1 Tax=Stylophora pistillata TaxID=50429 RepID=A0A2B4RTP1_STYPI|nr:RNA-directed DNA polymerase from mobile element jockey [Stylophora pistillata]
MPTKLVLASIEQLLPVITQMINSSLLAGHFPKSWKEALVDPRQKKAGINDFGNLRPVSNLQYVSKLTERAVFDQVHIHLTTHDLYPKLQSAYRRGHSTETALLKIHNDILIAMDRQHVILLVLLDLSAAFDTVEHSVLLSRLSNSFGIRDTALCWFRSYLSHRSQRVSLDGKVSGKFQLIHGVPHGSFLGPLLFSLYKENVILGGVIPAVDHEPKSLNRFLEPAVNELNALWKGVKVNTYRSSKPIFCCGNSAKRVFMKWIEDALITKGLQAIQARIEETSSLSDIGRLPTNIKSNYMAILLLNGKTVVLFSIFCAKAWHWHGPKNASSYADLAMGIIEEKALIKDLKSLPNITSVRRIKDIHDFYGQLSRTVRTLAIMKKLQGAQSYAYNIMNKLGPLREAMVQKDDKWEEWGLEELVENLRKYTDRNPLPETLTPSNEVKKPLTNQGSHQRRGDKMLMSGSTSRPPRQQQMPTCVYCSSHSHRSLQCTKVIEVARRKEFLKSNRLCFNCARFGHAAAQCRSKGRGKCNGRHHTSICGRLNTTLPSNSASTSLVPTDRIERRIMEQMYGTVDKQVEIYKVHLKSDAIDDFKMELPCINAEKPVLTYLPNPKIPDWKLKNSHIKRLVFSKEAATEEKLPVHVILGAADIQRIKSTEPAVLR